MFSFLNPALLVAAFAALIPLIIHLFSRRRLKVIEFSSLKHLQAMQKRQVRRLKIRQLLLLLLRMLIILAIVLAFARPTSTGGNIGAHASVAAVIVLDNSASMDREVPDGNLFELVKRRTQTLLENFGEADEIALIPLVTSDDPTAHVSFSSAATAREQLRQLNPSAGRVDFTTVLENANELLGSAAQVNRELYIITDRQRRLLPDKQLLQDSDVEVYLVDFDAGATENCGITKVDLGGQLLMPGQMFTISASVRNYGDQDRSDIIASLYLDGRRIAQTDVQVDAGRETSVPFDASLTRGGFHSGYIELSDDHFAEDNRYYFSLHIPTEFNVLIIEGDGSGQFWSLALSPQQTAQQYWSVKSASPEQLPQVRLDEYDLVLLTGAPVLQDTYVTRLKSFVRGGKALFVTYDVSTDTAFFNRHWSDVTGVTIDEPASANFSRAGHYTLGEWDATHPIFAIFDYDKAAADLSFFTLPQVTVQKPAETIARFSGNRPAIVEFSFGSGRVLTFTAPLLPQYSDLTGHAFFVPFAARTAEYLAARLSSYDIDLYADQRLSRSLSWRGAISAPLEIVRPDSSITQEQPVEQKGNLVYSPKGTDQPGVYHVAYVGREVDRFAVNLNPAEADLRSADIDQFATSIGAKQVHTLDKADNLAVSLAEFRFGKELWQIFLWIAVLLLAAEMLLARSAANRE